MGICLGSILKPTPAEERPRCRGSLSGRPRAGSRAAASSVWAGTRRRRYGRPGTKPAQSGRRSPRASTRQGSAKLRASRGWRAGRIRSRSGRPRGCASRRSAPNGRTQRLEADSEGRGLSPLAPALEEGRTEGAGQIVAFMKDKMKSADDIRATEWLADRIHRINTGEGNHEDAPVSIQINVALSPEEYRRVIHINDRARRPRPGRPAAPRHAGSPGGIPPILRPGDASPGTGRHAFAAPRAARPGYPGGAPEQKAGDVPVRAHGLPPGPQPTVGKSHPLHPDRTRESKLSH